MWEIIDEKGTIYSGSQEEMNDQFSIMATEHYDGTWEGDLKLIEIHGMIK